VAFAFYRGVFASLRGSQQAAIAPLFTMMKLGFKDASIRLLSYGGNPDAAPMAAFAFDVLCGTRTANVLFIDVADFRAVLAIIAADMLENVALTWSCIAAIDGERGACKRERVRSFDGELDAIKHGRSAEAVIELSDVQLGLQLARENERLEKRIYQLESGTLKTMHATEALPLLEEEDVDLAGPRMSSTKLHATPATPSRQTSWTSRGTAQTSSSSCFGCAACTRVMTEDCTSRACRTCRGAIASRVSSWPRPK
jgi:hypothetical protein